MSITLKHNFVSAKGNDADPTLIQPSAWNDNHSITMAANSVIGNSTGSTGAATEIPAGAAGLSILASVASADLITALTALGATFPTTGDLKPTLKFTPDAGWLMIDDSTIGNISSSADFSGVAYQALFEFVWTNYSQPSSNVAFPVSGGLGASASADWAAQKTLKLGPFIGRVAGVASPSGKTGSGLTERLSGQALGEENHLLTIPEMPSHSHTDSGHDHAENGSVVASATGPLYTGGGANSGDGATAGSLGLRTGSGAANIQPTGGGGAHNNMQPTIFINWMIKL